MNAPESTTKVVSERLRQLRNRMQQARVAACVVTNFDPHHSEYAAPHWLARQFISGFTGSAGTVVITADGGGLWTDGRYLLQASEQLAGTGFAIINERDPSTPGIPEWLVQHLAPGSRVTVAGDTISRRMQREYASALAAAGLELDTGTDLVASVWQDRPLRSQAAAFEFPYAFAGCRTAERLLNLRSHLRCAGLDGLLISALPDICWLLNVRGADVPFCPLVEGHLFVDAEHCAWFVDPAKVGSQLQQRLLDDGVEVRPAGDLRAAIGAWQGRISLCPDSTSAALSEWIPAGVEVLEEAPPTELAKAVKHPVERAALRETLRHDGAAMVQFAFALEQALDNGQRVTELDIEAQLAGLRAQQPNALGPSFRTIAGYGAHGAHMHYGATPESNAEIGRERFLLVDSGGQYLGGTTDITRTFHFGHPSAEECADYTSVLRAVIRLSQARFKRGTRGCNLDVLARELLWQRGIDYDCGTGHGVGQCLVVHEGPQALNQRLVDQPLLPGMVITNEPGIYRPGRYGVRIENILEVVAVEETEFGEFLGFETITLAPLQTRALDLAQLSETDIGWIDRYHARVLRELSPLLAAPQANWLARACAPLELTAG